MLHYSTIPQPTMMKEQQQECSEIHTIQIFREAPSMLPVRSSSLQGARQSPDMTTTSTVISDQRAEAAYGIGGDWAIEMDEDVIEQPSAVLEMTLPNYQEGESSLYSFYFEKPVVSMTQDQSSDDFTITSHDTESFHNNNDFDLDSMEDIWDQGLDQSCSKNEEMCISQSNFSSSKDSIRNDER